MTKVRPHRATLTDSLAKTVPATSLDELTAVIRDDLTFFDFSVLPSAIRVTPYGFDERCGWDLHAIKIDGYGLWGFADGPL